MNRSYDVIVIKGKSSGDSRRADPGPAKGAFCTNDAMGIVSLGAMGSQRSTIGVDRDVSAHAPCAEIKEWIQMKPIAYEKVTMAEAKRVHDGAPPDATCHDWKTRRAGPEAHELIREETSAWMRELPGGVRPAHLAERFPRIANKICALWTQPLRCAAYLSDLLIARRVSRQGFPAEVAMEIGNLSTHYELLNPIGRPWQ